MPKWVAFVLTISGASIMILLGVVGFFSAKTLEDIRGEIVEIKGEVKTMNHDYSRLSQSVAVMMAVNESHAKQCEFPKPKQERN